MKVLVFSPSLPLPFGTADARWLWVMCSEMAGRGIEVRCLSCTQESGNRVEQAEKLAADAGFGFRHASLRIDESVPMRKLRSLRRPFSEIMRGGGVAEAIDEERVGADVVHVEHLFSFWPFREDPRALLFLHHLEEIDWSEQPNLSLRERQIRWQIGRATKTLLRSASRVMPASTRLERRALEINPRLETAVVPVSLDAGRYEELPPVSDPVVGVIGSMHWYPSRSAAERVLVRLWPEILRRVPSARLLVAGWNADKYLGSLFPVPGAELLGAVDHPTDFFSRIAVLLYPPAKGSGYKIKVLESMAYGVPVVSNAEGLEGLEPFDGDGVYFRGETDAELIDRTVAMLEDATRRRDTAQRARRLIVREYSPVPAVDRLLDAYKTLGVWE